MARSSDRERIIWLLQEQGQSSNRYVRTTLKLTDDRYKTVKEELLTGGLIQKVKGQGGGIKLTQKGLGEKALPNAQSSVASEKDLYAPFVRVLSEESKENEEPALTIDTSSLRRTGKWTNPDVVKIAVRKFPVLRTHRVVVTTYELKQWKRWNIDSVFEAASQRRFAHESYVVLEWAKEEEVEGLDEMLAVCGQFGVGLLTLHPYYSSYRYHVQLEAQKSNATDEYLEEFLGYILEKNSDKKTSYDALFSGNDV